MIIPWDRITDFDDPFGGKLFRGQVADDASLNWESRLPNITTLNNSAAADPALAASLGGLQEFAAVGQMGSSMEPLQQFIGELALADWIDGSRQTIGEIAQTAGIVSSHFNDLDTIFKASRGDLMASFDVADMAINSEVFKLAINSIGAIPVVGWVIKIAYEISRAIAAIVIASKDSNAATARKLMSRDLTIPLGSMDFDPEVNDVAAQAFFRLIRQGQAQAIIEPSYHMNPSAPNMGFVAEGVFANQGDDMASGWIVRGGHGTGGLGFVPGTSSMTRALFFPSGVKSAPNSCGLGCGYGSVRDLATLYPTAQSMCTSWWSQVNAPGPAMYTVRPLAARASWENYIEQMYALAENIMKGWTCAPTGIQFKDKFRCYSPELTCGGGSKKSKKGMGNCDHGNRGKTLTIPSDFGRVSETVFYGYISRLFFGIESVLKTSKGGVDQLPRVGSQSYTNDLGHKRYRADALDLSESVPVSALNTLHANQRATLNSLQCMYVAGDSQNRDRFPAFNDHSLRSLWEQSVTDVFASDSWRRVVYQDMPEGEAKTAFRNYAQSKGIQDVENFNRPCRPGEKPSKGGCGYQGSGMKLAAHHQIPDDPSLPQKPEINGAVVKNLKIVQGVGGGSSSKKKSSNMPLILAGGALAYLFMKGRK